MFWRSGLADQTTTSHGEFGINSDWSFLEDKDNSLEQIFWKIEIVHSRVHKLKAQLDLVMSKNAGKFSSSENLSHLVPCDVQTSSVRSPTFSACNGDTMLMGGLYDPIHHISEYDLGDLVLPESAVSSFGEAIDIPDIIESTVGLLSSADVTQHYSQIGDSCEDVSLLYVITLFLCPFTYLFGDFLHYMTQCYFGQCATISRIDLSIWAVS